MNIRHVQVVNYKGFRDSGRIALGDKFTVFVGQNNAGKTALLEALSVRFANNPFREPAGGGDLPRVFDPVSRITFDSAFTGRELKWRALHANSQFDLSASSREPNIEPVIDSFFSRSEIVIEVRFAPSNWRPVDALGVLKFAHIDQRVHIHPSEDRQRLRTSRLNGGGDETIVQNLVGPYLASSLYVFRAERMNFPECPISGEVELRPDASNLASVLLQLDGNPAAQDQFTKCVRTIFPSIYSIVSKPRNDTPSIARLDVINKDFAKEGCQPGISVALADSGTGIGQVLAILYVVITAPTPKVIVIDEPNSFLHPGAAKKLIAILREFDHQYIFTTHSADIIRATQPDIVHLVKWAGGESEIETIDGKDAVQLSRLLRELGVQLADVFGADNVLWVEGPTEEICFPLLFKLAKRQLPPATAIVAIVSPDDLSTQRTRRSLAWEVYERLSIGTALTPPALAFSFDREGRTNKDILDMLRRSKGRAHFLPRRTYENYLLNAEAISAVLQSAEINKTAAEVQSWIDQNGGHNDYFRNLTAVDVADPTWSRTVDAAKLLSAMFEDLADATLIYRKVEHSVAITEWLIANKPEELQELVEYLDTLLPEPGTGADRE